MIKIPPRLLSQLAKILPIFLILIITYFFYKHGLLIGQDANKKYINHINDYQNNCKYGDNLIDYHDNDFELIYDKNKYPFTIVTAASKNHFCTIQGWLYYMKDVVNSIPVSKRPRIIVYDLGLDKVQRRLLNILLEKEYMTELRVFNFEIYPKFWRLVNNTKGEYGWKAGIISEIIRDYPGPILWLDSGSYVSSRFLKYFRIILNYYDGFFSPKSSGYMTDWTHPDVFKYFNDDAEKYSDFINCNGAIIAFDSNKVNAMMNNWIQCAQIKDCIAPNGSNRENHRQDQAILTYFVAKEKRSCTNQLKFFGLRTHMDYTCKKLNNIIINKRIG